METQILQEESQAAASGSENNISDIRQKLAQMSPQRSPVSTTSFENMRQNMSSPSAARYQSPAKMDSPVTSGRDGSPGNSRPEPLNLSRTPSSAGREQVDTPLMSSSFLPGRDGSLDDLMPPSQPAPPRESDPLAGGHNGGRMNDRFDQLNTFQTSPSPAREQAGTPLMNSSFMPGRDGSLDDLMPKSQSAPPRESDPLAGGHNGGRMNDRLDQLNTFQTSPSPAREQAGTPLMNSSFLPGRDGSLDELMSSSEPALSGQRDPLAGGHNGGRMNDRFDQLNTFQPSSNQMRTQPAAQQTSPAPSRPASAEQSRPASVSSRARSDSSASVQRSEQQLAEELAAAREKDNVSPLLDEYNEPVELTDYSGFTTEAVVADLERQRIQANISPMEKEE